MAITLLRAVTAGVLPVLLSILYDRAEKRTRFASLPYGTKQLLIGVSFGFLAVLATESGVPLNGAVFSVRDAAPLTAGLVFGWPAGLLAGFIGGAERWFAVLWSASTFTRLAGSLGTVLAGLIGAPDAGQQAGLLVLWSGCGHHRGSAFYAAGVSDASE